MKRITKSTILFLGLFLVFMWGKTAFAQPRGGGNVNQHVTGGLLFETLPDEDKRELIESRKEYKEEFGHIVKEKLSERKKELKQIRSGNPGRFKEIIRQSGANIKKREKQLREKQRETADRNKDIQRSFLFATLPKDEQKKILRLRKEYQETLSNTLKVRKEELEKLQRDDPERFGEIMDNARQNVKQLLKKGNVQYPEKMDKFKRMKFEHLQEKLEWLKSDDPDLYNELMGKFRK